MEKKNFEIVVPYNHEMFVAERRKSKIIGGTICLVLAVGFAVAAFVLALLGGISGESILFAVFAILLFIPSMCALCTLKPNSKNDNKKLSFYFGEDGLAVVQTKGEGKERVLQNCLYREFQDKQYVSKVFEYEEKFQLQIYTGTTNGVSQHSYESIPKSIFESDTQLEEFKTFIQEKVGRDYISKPAKKSAK